MVAANRRFGGPLLRCEPAGALGLALASTLALACSSRPQPEPSCGGPGCGGAPVSPEFVESAEVEDDAVVPAGESVGEREALQLRADDGHALRLWHRSPRVVDAALPPILLLHGRTWSSVPDFDLPSHPERSTMVQFASRGAEVYAVDLRGYGESERDATGCISPTRARDDLLAAVDAVGEREGRAPVVVGWSMGSLVTHFAAQTRPDAFAGVVLYGYPLDHRTAIAGPKSVAEAGEAPPRAATTAEAAAEDFRTEGSIDAAAIEAFVAAALAADPVRADWRARGEFAALKPESLTVPTMVIHGAGDPYAPAEAQAALFTRLGTNERRWVILDQSDHAAHLERVGPWIDAVFAFARAR